MLRPLSAGLVAVFVVLACALAQNREPDRSARWEKEVAAIEKRLHDHPPAEGSIAFAGSSSIRLWDLKKSFPDLDVVNLGFGGSQLPDSTHFTPRLIVPLKPRTIVLYAGDNDVAAGRTPDQIRNDFTAFVKLVHTKLPKTNIIYIAIKPSLARWKQFEKQQKANALVKAICEKDEQLKFLDVVPEMLGPDGKPDPELFRTDGLHMNAKGYEIWSAALKKILTQK